MIEFIYHGTADVPQDSINDFIKTAQTLDIKGLADDKAGNKQVRKFFIHLNFFPVSNLVLVFIQCGYIFMDNKSIMTGLYEPHSSKI